MLPRCYRDFASVLSMLISLTALLSVLCGDRAALLKDILMHKNLHW